MVRRDIRRFIEEHQPNLVIARDIYSLPLLRGIFPRESTWIDLPDISDDVSTYRPLLRIVLGPYFRHLSRALSESAALFTTVSNSLASHFFQRNAIECSVVRNSLPYRKLTQRSSRAAVASRSDSQVPLRMVYVGAALRRREIEICLDAMDFLPDFYSLDLYLVPTDTTYLQELIDRYSHNPSIRFMPQVPLMELVDVMSLYDLALIVIPLNSQNAVGALPNKFFQAVQARLPVVTGPSPEIAHYVRKFEIGIVAADFTPQSIAGACINICETALDRFHSGLEVAALELSDNSDLNQIHHRAMLMLRRI
jgi:glycosyltransferase involved in cell wall biosynthesis